MSPEADSFSIEFTAESGLNIVQGGTYVRREPKKLDTQNQMEILAESLFDMANFYSEEDHDGVGRHARAFAYIATAARNAAQGKQWMGEDKWE